MAEGNWTKVQTILTAVGIVTPFAAGKITAALTSLPVGVGVGVIAGGAWIAIALQRRLRQKRASASPSGPPPWRPMQLTKEEEEMQAIEALNGELKLLRQPTSAEPSREPNPTRGNKTSAVGAISVERALTGHSGNAKTKDKEFMTKDDEKKRPQVIMSGVVAKNCGGAGIFSQGCDLDISDAEVEGCGSGVVVLNDGQPKQ